MTWKWCLLPGIAVAALGMPPATDAEPPVAAKVRVEPDAIDALRRDRDALIAVAETEAALEPAREIVARLETGDADPSEDLLKLGLIHASLGDHAAAESAYLRAIEARERRHGIFAAALIPAYHALGRAYLDAGRLDDALAALEHARTLSHRNYGLFNLEQIALLDDMTRAHLAAGDTAAAHALELERLHKAIRRFGADAPALVPFYRHLGDYYYRRLGDRYGNLPSRFRAHDQYMKALEIASTAHGDTSPECLDLLRRLIAVEMHIDDRPRGEGRLRAALAAGGDTIDPEQRGLSLAALGDWAVVEGDAEAAERYYRDAYDVLRAADGVDVDALFAAPKMLDFLPPPDGVAGTVAFAPWRWGRIEVAFDVSADGRARNVRTVAIAPRIAALEEVYLKRIAATHFRPRLEDGRPVDRADVRYVHEFRYYPSD